MKRALIVEDGREAFILAAARGLAADGWSVGLAGPERNIRASASRAVDQWHHVPPAPDRSFTPALAHVVAHGGYDIVFAGDDAEAVAVSAARDRLGAVVPYPDHDALLALIDKQRLASAAAVAGIGTPPTCVATDDVVAGHSLPAVVKAGLHWRPGVEGEGRFPATVVGDRDALRERVRQLAAAGATPLLQELVPGRLHALTVLVGRDGGTIAAVQQRSLRLTPGQTSARAVTTPVDPLLLARVERMLASLTWRGLVNLQFLVDGDTWRLIDANARFYGSLALAIAAGVNLPALWAAEWCGPAPSAPVVARTGVRWQTLDGDLLRARAEARPVRAVAGTLAFSVLARHTTPSARDPRPILRWYATRAARRLRRAR